MEKIASIFRKIARPPIFAVAFLLIISVVNPAWVGSIGQLLGGILTLGVLPILGYPLQKYIPHFRDKGRDLGSSDAGDCAGRHLCRYLHSDGRFGDCSSICIGSGDLL